MIGNWLVHLADPLGPSGPRPRGSLTTPQVHALFVQAELHGVLASVLRNLEFRPDQSAIKADALSRHRNAVGFGLMLRQHSQPVTQRIAATGLPCVVVKGPVFARKLYPQRELRGFTDIDLLVAPEAVPQLAPLLTEQGFACVTKPGQPSAQEWKWIHRDNDQIMIEVQTNLVHAPSLRAVVSLGYADLVQNGDALEAERPAALLVTAVVHGSCGHHYERLQHVVDICQAGRCLTGPDDERQLEQLIDRTGARLAAVAGLELAGRLFHEPRCFELAKTLGPVRYARLCRSLITSSVVTSTMTRARPLHSWRRAAFRDVLKRSVAPRTHPARR